MSRSQMENQGRRRCVNPAAPGSRLLVEKYQGLIGSRFRKENLTFRLMVRGRSQAIFLALGGVPGTIGEISLYRRKKSGESNNNGRTVLMCPRICLEVGAAAIIEEAGASGRRPCLAGLCACLLRCKTVVRDVGIRGDSWFSAQENERRGKKDLDNSP